MKYTSANLGRVFVLRFENGDNMQRVIRDFCVKERVLTGTMVFIGALRRGKIVAGPKKPVVPPDPNVVSYSDGWEMMGVGTIFPDGDGEPQIHLHASFGKAKKTLVGCVRQDSEVFMVIEAVLFELTGARCVKARDPRTGLNLLNVLSRGRQRG